jgi:signal transduction histidine kinase/tetratricopeptide (TPR) repeat protein
MKNKYLLICFVFALSPAMAQKAYFDSLRHLVITAKTDSDRIRRISELIINDYGRNQPDSSIMYGGQLVAWGKKTNNKSITAIGFRGGAYGLYSKGDYPAALDKGLAALRIIEETKDTGNKAKTYLLVGDIYKGQQNYARALYYYQQAKQLGEAFPILRDWAEPSMNIAFVYERTNALDSARYYAKKYLSYKNSLSATKPVNYVYGILGNVYFKLKKYDSALLYYRKGYSIAKTQNKFRGVSEIGISLSNFYNYIHKSDSAIYYARQALLAAKRVSYNKSVYEAAALLSSLYESRHMPDSAFKYLKISSATKDSLYNATKSGEVANLTISELERQNEIQAANAAYRSRLRLYVLGCALLVFLAMALLQLINSRQKKRAYILLKKQKEEIEAQRAQALIEAALEKVRGRTMAMQRSGELAEVSELLFNQLRDLGNSPGQVTLCIVNEPEEVFEMWITTMKNPQFPTFKVTIHEPSVMSKVYQAWKEQKKSLTIDLTGEELLKYENFRKALGSSQLTDGIADGRRVVHSAFFSKGAMTLAGSEPQPPETIQLLERFAGVFDGTYTRFLDLEKAEAQAREAQIEASLERVRSKTMAMHNSQDVGETAAAMFDELIKLGVETSVRCGVLIIDKTKHMEVWAAASDNESKVSLLIGSLDMTIHPLLQQLYAAWENKKPHFLYELRGDDLKNYYRAITEAPDYPFQYDLQSIPDEQMTNLFFFQEGGLFAFTVEPLSDDVARLFKRFAAVFGLTYRRFLDLQKAEAQTREVIKQASVDRVRAEIASMRSTSDLERITPLIWNELTTLGVPFIRCGVFIMDENNRVIHTYLSTPDGQALAAFELSFDTDGIGKEALAHWRRNQIYSTHWAEEEFAAFSKALVDRGAVESDEKYRTAHPPTSLDLHFFPFLQGMLYVGNIAPLGEDEMNMVQSLAEAFSTAYARYEDFNKLEQAKQQVDKTLTELKATQTQLIQSEKMASLGELTAGIAHEIQNPLNFVNNFSEVNTEMLEELKAESIKPKAERDDQLENDLINDLIENEQKINHHGKRADAIVKGMLEHSRVGKSEKQLANINKLADEYLRLAYHGLRAKDKTFNAELVTHFDEHLPLVNVVPQDIGRVFVNLLTNAFYAVNQKQQSSGKGYKPEVSVTTTTENGELVIKVKDNGNGIPDAIKDKIMQPFFTTKPTGEGTGLGLSLSYDIVVKGHGGNIKMESKEGEGSIFTIILPIN